MLHSKTEDLFLKSQTIKITQKLRKNMTYKYFVSHSPLKIYIALKTILWWILWSLDLHKRLIEYLYKDAEIKDTALKFYKHRTDFKGIK